jgi:hypothetical protein
MSRCEACKKSFHPCGPKLTPAERKQKQEATSQHSREPSNPGVPITTPPCTRRWGYRQHLGDYPYPAYPHGPNLPPSVSSEGGTFLLKTTLAGTLASHFPQLDKGALWMSVEEAFVRLHDCADGDVEKLGVVDFLLDEPNRPPMSPATSISSLDTAPA